MPVSSEISVSGPYFPNGATVGFAFDFKAASADEVVAVDGSGVVISRALYSISLDEDEGGSLVFGTAPRADQYPKIYVVSDPALTQPSDFDNSGPSFNPAAVTRAFDRAAVRDLKQQREIDRAIKVPFGEDAPAMGSLVGANGKALGVVGGAIVPIANDVAGAEQIREDAAGFAADAAASRVAAGASAAAANASEAGADAARELAEEARDQASAAGMSQGIYPIAARDYVPRGAVGTGALTPGASGANGTFDLAFTGGNFSVNPTGTFTVTGGALTAINITGPGLYIGAAPTAPTLSFAASAGLAGAAASISVGYLVGGGRYYYTFSLDDGYVSQFQNVANVATLVEEHFDPLSVGAAGEFAEAAEAAAAQVVGRLDTTHYYEEVLHVFQGEDGETPALVMEDGGWAGPLRLLAAGGVSTSYDPTTRVTTLGFGDPDYPGLLPSGEAYIGALWYFEGVTFAQFGDDGDLLTLIPETDAEPDTDVAALTARVDASLDDDGNLRAHLYGQRYLREFTRYREMLADGETILLHVAFAPADSYTEDDAWVTKLARQWKVDLGNGGFGWTGVGFPSSVNGGSNADKAAAGTGNIDAAEMAVSFTGTGWTGDYTRVVGSPDLCAATSSTAADRVTFTYAGADDIATVEAFWIGGSGVSRYRWNGGSWTTLNLSGAGGQSAMLAGMPAGAWTLDWEVVSGTCQICGVSGLTGNPGIVVHDLANNGSALCNWARMGEADPAGDRAKIADAMARLGDIRTFIAPIGPNDQGQGWTAAQFESAAGLFVDEVARVASPGCDFLLVCAPENGRDPGTYPNRLAGYARVAKGLVTGKEIVVLDMQPLFGATYAEYGDTGTERQLFEADLLHPNTAGGATYKAAIHNAVTTRS